MTEHGEQVDDRLEAGYRAQKHSERRSKMKELETTVQLTGDITKESEEMQI